ncbi:DUF262 domain-containing protein [Bacillus subtilis]|uniref:DUF262 domain-containing protein n=1 Tax=Bacillus subtilis TaxID=1423 RepID=UPI004056DEFC
MSDLFYFEDEKDEELDDTPVDFEEEFDEQINEIPSELRKLRVQAYDKSVSDLVRMVKDKEIILTPEYQRNFIWDTKKSSLLVESILLNIPIPVIYASEEKDSRWNIVDGLQRLTALNRFINNDFKLRGLIVLSELNNLKYEELPPKAKRVLNNGNLRTILIFNDSHPEIKYDIFMRLNSGAVKLNEQELRNCLYRGNLNQLIKKLTHNPKFMKILGLKHPHKRMADQEIILRYLAFSEGYDSYKKIMVGYKGATKPYLNSYFEKNQNISEEELNYLEKKFNSVIDAVYEVFGDKAFRKLNEDGFETKINKAIMDVIMISFEGYPIEGIKAKREEILSNYKEILTDPTFNKSVTQGTSDTKALENRLNVWISKMQSIMLTAE